jgi:hypothetical protein
MDVCNDNPNRRLMMLRKPLALEQASIFSKAGPRNVSSDRSQKLISLNLTNIVPERFNPERAKQTLHQPHTPAMHVQD